MDYKKFRKAMGKKDQTLALSYFTLFVKFSRRVPNPLSIQDEVRKMYSNVLNVRKPRQKSARWILVDFENELYADEFKALLEKEKHIATLPVKVKKLNIKQNDPTKPDNERQDKINSMSKNTFDAKKLEKYSNKLLVTNLPDTITLNELRTLFPNNQKIDLKHSPKIRAIVTYSSAKEAFDMRLALASTIVKEKYRVIVLLLNNDKPKRQPDAQITKKIKDDSGVGGRYFEASIE